MLPMPPARPAQGVSDKVLEAELPDLPVEQRAAAINALLTVGVLQGEWAAWVGGQVGGWVR